MSDVRNTLKKKERLSSGIGLSRLFADGRYGTAGVIRYCFRAGNELTFNRIVVSVPKKCFRRAVKRNLLKRRIREAYRLNKSMLHVLPDGGIDILFIYTSREIMDSAAISADIRTALSAVNARCAARAAKAAMETPAEDVGNE